MTSATTILPFQLLNPKCSPKHTSFGPSPSFFLPSKPLKTIAFSKISSWACHKNKISPLKIVTKTSDWSQQVTQQEEAADASNQVEVEVEVEVEGGEEETYSEPPEDAKIFVGNLPYDFDSEKLAQLFNTAGTVDIAEVIYNRDTEQSRGFGFVTMSTVEEVNKAVEKFNGYVKFPFFLLLVGFLFVYIVLLWYVFL